MKIGISDNFFEYNFNNKYTYSTFYYQIRKYNEVGG